MIERQDTEQPVHTWELAARSDLERVTEWSDSCRYVSQLMTSDVFTVRPGDLVDLAASLMDWEHLRHVPVEDESGRLVGLISHRSFLRLVARGHAKGEELKAVRELMTPDPVTIHSSASTLEAVEMMRNNTVGCLPVVDDGRLVGIITESDLVAVAARLLDDHLREL
jgi:CBS domain-containing protein